MFSLRELPTYEETKHYKEISVLSHKIQNARPRINTIATVSSQQIPNQLVLRSQRQRQAKYKQIEKQNKQILKNLCEIAQKPSKCLVDAGIIKPNGTAINNTGNNNGNNHQNRHLQPYPRYSSPIKSSVRGKYSRPRRSDTNNTSWNELIPALPLVQKKNYKESIPKINQCNREIPISTSRTPTFPSLPVASRLSFPASTTKRPIPRVRSSNVSRDKGISQTYDRRNETIQNCPKYKKEQRIEKLLKLLNSSEDQSSRHSGFTMNVIHRNYNPMSLENKDGYNSSSTFHDDILSPWTTEPSPPRKSLLDEFEWAENKSTQPSMSSTDHDECERLLLREIIHQLDYAIERASSIGSEEHY